MPRRPTSHSGVPFALPDDLLDDAPTPPRTSRNARPTTNRFAPASETNTSSTSSGSLRRRLSGDNSEATADNRTPFDAALHAAPLVLLDLPAPKRRGTTRTAPAFSASNSQSKPRARKRGLSADLKREIAGVLCVAVGCVLLVNMLRGEGDSFFASHFVNALRWLFGVGALAAPVVLLLLGILLVARKTGATLQAFGRGAVCAFAVALTWVHLDAPRAHPLAFDQLTTHGGIFGAALSYLLRSVVGDIGARIVLIAVAIVCLLLWTELSLSSGLSRFSSAASQTAQRLRRSLATRAKRRKHAKADADADTFSDDDSKSENNSQNDLQSATTPEHAATPPVRPRRLRHAPLDNAPDEAETADAPAPTIAPRVQHPVLPLQSDIPGANAPDETTLVNAAPRVEIANIAVPPSILDNDEPQTPAELLEQQAQATSSDASKAQKSKSQDRACRSFGESIMPPYFDDALRGMDAPLPLDVSGVEDDIAEGVAAVQDTLGAFRVDARVTDVKRGPVITRYEVQPAPGVRVAAIANLDRDLARSLSALAVRIEAPVPGKNVVGIEVPNKRVHLVRMRDVLELPDFLGAPSKLSFVLGRDIAGQPKWADLTKMPHLLIAGATNSGKSVCLNSIIASILLRATPDEVKFSLIDPKRVELTLFRDIKHLYHPVVVEPKDAVRALKGAIAEMDRRYRKFSARGCRNIASYNSKLEPDEKPLPYLVIVIDELADLMMTAAAEFEKLICRIAQLARATGIHLIVATQRPSVNVITGVIKANIPARIAFAVASQVDSRTILDAVGAERLIGSGDMLFDANNGGKALRIQGAYLSEEEVNRVVEAVKLSYRDDLQPLDYGMDLAMVADDDSIGGGTNRDEIEDKRDGLYDEIRAFVVRHQEMSASNIQRKFEIGYPRAGRIVDQLERDGVLGPADGPKARKVLVSG